MTEQYDRNLKYWLSIFVLGSITQLFKALCGTQVVKDDAAMERERKYDDENDK